MENIGNLRYFNAAPRKSAVEETNEILEQIDALEADTESPIAIGKTVRVKRGDEMIDGGWHVSGFAVNDTGERAPHVVAIVEKEDEHGNPMTKRVMLGTLRMLNPEERKVHTVH